MFFSNVKTSKLSAFLPLPLGHLQLLQWTTASLALIRPNYFPGTPLDKELLLALSTCSAVWAVH